MNHFWISIPTLELFIFEHYTQHTILLETQTWCSGNRWCKVILNDGMAYLLLEYWEWEKFFLYQVDSCNSKIKINLSWWKKIQCFRSERFSQSQAKIFFKGPHIVLFWQKANRNTLTSTITRNNCNYSDSKRSKYEEKYGWHNDRMFFLFNGYNKMFEKVWS